MMIFMIFVSAGESAMVVSKDSKEILKTVDKKSNKVFDVLADLRYDFNPEISVVFTNTYNLQSPTILIQYSQEGVQEDPIGITMEFHSGSIREEVYSMGDVIGEGHATFANGTYYVDYNLLWGRVNGDANQIDMQVTGTNFLPAQRATMTIGTIFEMDDSVFVRLGPLPNFDGNNLTNGLTNSMVIYEGLYWNQAEGEVEIRSTITSELGTIVLRETIIDINQYGASYCDLMFGDYRHNEEQIVNGDNGHLDLNEDGLINLSDIVLFATNRNDEQWCAYHIASTL